MSGLDRLGRRIALEQDALRARSPARRQVRERLAALQLRAAMHPLQRKAVVAVCVGLAAAALFGLGVRRLGEHKPLTLVVGALEKPADVGTFIEAPKAEAFPLRFSDGTRIEMAPRSRARLVGIDHAGAHLLLESGRASVAVIHRAHASWQLSVGPFAVRITGTRFEIGWDPEQDQFELDLEQGHVEVSGCVFGEGYGMSAGQKVRASCKRRRFDVTDRRRDPEAFAGAQRAPSTIEAQPGRDAVGGIASAAKPHSRQKPAVATRFVGSSATPAAVQSWRALAEQGKYAEAFAAADALGFDAQCAHATSADELGMLADAARYAREAKKEAHALRLLRRRFAGTQRAALSAFALGRLAFDRYHSYDKAAAWFGTYLTEYPTGPLTREARGRMIEATLRAGDVDHARELALQYLRTYPSGPHSNLARGLAGASAP